MAWPEPTDYNEAIQNPQVCFGDDELRRAQPVTNALGLPIACAGNFALVYQLTGASGDSWAVKCFTREAPARQQRYQAISAHLYTAALPFTVDFHYLEQGIRVGGQWFPVVKMRWVEGLTVNALLREHVDRPQVLQRLAQMWLPLAQKLRRAGIAHADLQHGNVLLVPGQKAATLDLRLIDYDGMFVPALAGVPSGEVGHPNYQHPQRLRAGGYDAESDRFAHLVIYTALRCLLAGGRSLWERYDNGENLLFREQDFREPASSKLLEELWRSADPDAQALVGHLLLAGQDPLERVPLLEELIDDGRVMPLTPRQEKRVRELLPGGTQAGPVPVELTALIPALATVAGGESTSPPLSPGGREGGGEGAPPQVTPVAFPAKPKSNPYASPSAPVATPEAPAPRRTGLKTPAPTRTHPRKDKTTDFGPTLAARRFLVGAITGGLALVGLVVLAIALSGSGKSSPPPSPGEPPPARAARLGLAPVSPVALKGGERVKFPVRLEAKEHGGPIALQVEGLPERVRQEKPVSVLPGQDVAEIELRAELGAPEAVRQARIYARGQGVEAMQTVTIAVARQTTVSWLPTAPITLKAGESKAVALRLVSAGHDVPLELVVEGLPDKVRQQGNPLPLALGQTEGTVILAAAADAPPAVHKAQVWITAGGVKLVQQTLDIRIEPAQPALVLPPIAPFTIQARTAVNPLIVVQRQGCAGAVTVEATPPAGIRVAPLVLPDNVNSGNLTISADADAPPQFDLEITARLGDLKATQSVRVTVVGALAKAPPPRGRAVSFESADGVTLHGTFYLSSKGQNGPCVLLLHGLGETSQDPGWVKLAGALQHAGYTVLSFDFRGHGLSTTINPRRFWGQPFNKYASRAAVTKKTKQQQTTIHWKNFYKTYYPALANDIGAAKAFLDWQAHHKAGCSAGNVALIGGREGATLGALWLNAECHRYRVARLGLPPVYDPTPQGKNVTAAIWIGAEPMLGTVKTSFAGMLGVPARQVRIPVAFVHGEMDAQSKGVVVQCKALLKQKGVVGGARVVPGTATAGSALLAESPDTIAWVVAYLNQLDQVHNGNRGLVFESGHDFVWRIPRTAGTYTARTPADAWVRFDTFGYFVR